VTEPAMIIPCQPSSARSSATTTGFGISSNALCRCIQAKLISEVEITQASWAVTPRIPLNPGLVAVVGARGSGKTALTDVIAAGCDAIASPAWDADENISRAVLTDILDFAARVVVRLAEAPPSSVRS
jgi:hypothetical protein